MQALKRLVEVQGIDRSIFRIQQDLAAYPQRITALRQQLETSAARVKTAEGALTQAQRQHKDKELELQNREENLGKQQKQLFQLKSNKEYSAMQLEIKKSAADKSVLEETIIGLLETIDAAKTALEASRKELAAEQQRVAAEQKQIESEKSQQEAEMASLTAQRALAVDGDFGPGVLELYERILSSKKELALVPVRNDACQGCFMNVRPQLLSEIRMGKLVTCESCLRILYDENSLSV